MVEKTFRVISNSEKDLNAETIALALLRQITLNPSCSEAVFGVQEVTGTETYSSEIEELRMREEICQ